MTLVIGEVVMLVVDMEVMSNRMNKAVCVSRT